MIYIAPPYNTGKDFIYPDNYTESLQTYLEYTDQVDAEGRRFGTNADTDGRFHSKWLNMMYPRLYLARNLLLENGVIFVSCDDNEVHNLRALMNEVFGEENFIATVIWQKVYSPKNSARHFSEDHDYIVVWWQRSTVTIRCIPLRDACHLEKLEARAAVFPGDDKHRHAELESYASDASLGPRARGGDGAIRRNLQLFSSPPPSIEAGALAMGPGTPAERFRGRRSREDEHARGQHRPDQGRLHA